MSKELVRQGYDKIANRYLEQRDRFKNTKYLEKLNGLLRSGSTVFDIGCGSGVPIDRFLVDMGHTVIGIDIADKQIELARQNIPEGMYVVRDMSDLYEGEYQADAVVSFYAIFHIPREAHQKLFAKINSFLSIGGLLLVTMGFSDCKETEEDFHGVTMYWSHYNHEKNREIIEACGFEVVLDEIDTTAGERHQVVLGRKSRRLPVGNLPQ